MIAQRLRVATYTTLPEVGGDQEEVERAGIQIMRLDWNVLTNSLQPIL